jgi:hypothetical protein
MMENLVWAIILWLAIFIVIPLERIKQLLPAAAISFFFIFTVNHFFIVWGYYHFNHVIISVLGVPLIQAAGAAGGGLLLVNWLTPSPLSKILLAVGGSAYLSLSEYIFRQLGAFVYGNGFNPLLSFIHSLAMFSLLIWTVLTVMGGEKIYHGNKTRFPRH